MHKVTRNPSRQAGKNAARPSRYPIVDVARGAAIALMFVYHFMFDLRYYNVVTIDFNNDPVWLGLRTLIVSLFLGVMGVSLHLATANGLNQRAFGRRLLQVTGCAALVSMASYIMFPGSMIFFGILHFIATASVLGLLFCRWFWINLVLGTGLVILGLTFQHTWFDQRGWQWIGLMTHKPITEDYVPLVPWFGVVLLGLFVGKWIFSPHRDVQVPWKAGCRERPPHKDAQERPPSLAGALSETLTGTSDKPALRFIQWQGKNRFSRLLAFGGRHSLPIYMLHQPVFFAVLYLVSGKI